MDRMDLQCLVDTRLFPALSHRPLTHARQENAKERNPEIYTATGFWHSCRVRTVSNQRACCRRLRTCNFAERDDTLDPSMSSCAVALAHGRRVWPRASGR